MKKLIVLGSACVVTTGCAVVQEQSQAPSISSSPVEVSGPVVPVETTVATFAGGCFWCIESIFDMLPGVVSAVSGYTGGNTDNPTYDNHSGHREAVLVTYDPAVVTYGELLDLFWRNIDPTDGEGQFADRGFSYTTAIYVHDEDQRQIAKASKQSLDDSGQYESPIVTEIVDASDFYQAEEYHQDFAQKQSAYYERYAEGSGRKPYVRAQSEKYKVQSSTKDMTPPTNDAGTYDLTPEEIEVRLAELDPLSYHVIAEGGTESPFNNAYWNNKADGIYVDKVTGDPLFSSTHKYDSGTGWPSFHTTLQEENVMEKQDLSYGMVRTEIKSSTSDAHLGHVFSDGPEEHGGQRFCTNSASLLFVPKEEMESKGYGDWLYLFPE